MLNPFPYIPHHLEAKSEELLCVIRWAVASIDCVSCCDNEDFTIACIYDGLYSRDQVKSVKTLLMVAANF